MNTKTQIAKAYETATKTNGYAKLIDIINTTDIPAADLQQTIREMYREGWEIIPNSQGGDVTDEERRYCPTLGPRQVHLIGR